MRFDRLLRPIVLLVAAHSLVLGAALLARPRAVLALAGWPPEGPIFFPAQAGAFLVILGLGYLAGLRLRAFAWFLVLSKAVAVAFLAAALLARLAPPVVLPAAVLDGLMGLATAGALLRSRAARGGLTSGNRER